MVLKLNRSLVGVIEQTHHNPNNLDPLDNALFVGHAPLPSDVLREYTKTGVPSKGYVVVRWWRETQGRSGVAETDLVLIDRSFSSGDTVRKAGGSAGVVVGTSTTFILQPIWDPDRCDLLITTLEDCGAIGTLPNTCLSDSPDSCVSQLSAEIEHFSPHSLIYDVPGYELMAGGDFHQEDYVLFQDWLGTVEDVDLDVVLLLSDGTIVVADNERELEIVIPDSDRPIVNVPHTYYGQRPDFSFSDQGGLISTPPESLQRGQYVVTNKMNIAKGRFITGSCSDEVLPRGRVLDVRSRIVSVHWVCPNPFARDGAGDAPPGTEHRPYENILSYTSTESLKPNRRFVCYDHGKSPPTGSPTSNSIEAEFEVGDYVKFRDPVAATEKYRGQPNGHGKIKPIPLNRSYGFDLNEFKILCRRQEVHVLWQDGRRTVERSISLSRLILPESDLCPTDMVLHKEGLFQIEKGNSSPQAIPYNEMQYIQGDYDLLPQKIGVIQSVDSKERLARVRWFHEPNVRVTHHGLALGAGSSFGLLLDQTEEVSLYEVLTQPALDRRRGDLAIVAPQSLNPAIMQSIQNIPPSEGTLGITSFSFFDGFPSHSLFYGLRVLARELFLTWQPSIQSHSPRVNDWMGEIVDIGLDGFMTVRLGALQDCRDIRIPFERALTTISLDAEYDQPLSYYEPSSLSGSSSGSTIEQTIEYEGGAPLDDVSDEEMWLTDEESAASTDGSADKDDEDTEMLDAFSPPPNLASYPYQGHHQGSVANFVTQPHDSSVASLVHTSTEPVRFAVLDNDPPLNHFYVQEQQKDVPSRLRRIQKEYKILSSSLPAGIYVRSFESRLDLLRVMIIGPQDTPYEFAPLVIDIHLHEDFPAQPPHARFHSWTHGLGRINPNLYEDGKICLSLLGTWPGESGENWSDESSLLQLLVSLTGLVLVKDPFYNEAGFEALAADGTYATESSHYTEKAYIIARGFIKHALQYPVRGLEDILSWTYLPPLQSSDLPNTASQNRPNLLHNAISRAKSFMETANSSESRARDTSLLDGEGKPSKDGFLRKPSKGALVMLGRYIQDLEKILQEWTV